MGRHIGEGTKSYKNALLECQQIIQSVSLLNHDACYGLNNMTFVNLPEPLEEIACTHKEISRAAKLFSISMINSVDCSNPLQIFPLKM